MVSSGFDRVVSQFDDGRKQKEERKWEHNGFESND